MTRKSEKPDNPEGPSGDDDTAEFYELALKGLGLGGRRIGKPDTGAGISDERLDELREALFPKKIDLRDLE